MAGYTIVQEGETIEMLSARLARPSCMLLRANGLYAPVWLLSGREIVVPDRDFCQRLPPAICPVQALAMPAWSAQTPRIPGASPEKALQTAKTTGLPRRLILMARMQTLLLPDGCRCFTANYADTWQRISERSGTPLPLLMRLNRYWGPLLPGMRLVVPEDGRAISFSAHE